MNFEEGSGPCAKECWGPLETRKGQETDSPLASSRRNVVLPAPQFYLRKFFFLDF